MSRRDRATSSRRMPHPAWASFRQRVEPAAKTAIIALALTAVLGGWALHFLDHSPYCWASSIEIRLEPGQQWLSDPRLGYRLHPPVHILRADLAALAEAIRREHPQLARVAVHRELPNRLVAQVTLREPVGQLRGRQYYLVSADGVILAPGSPTAWEKLPVFLCGPRTAAYQPGQSCALPELSKAVSVLAEVQRARALGAHWISAVRVASAISPTDPTAITLVLDNGLELRATPGDLGLRLVRLAELMNHRSQEMEQAQYVDLRFDDLVIGMRGGE